MLRRIFLAVNLSTEVKSKLLLYKEKWPDLPAQWITPDNLHITLIFLGNTSEKELKEIEDIVREVASRHKPFSFSLSKIAYGPTAKQPKMVWATGEQSTELTTLQRDLAGALHQEEKHPFSQHITLARIKEWEFRKIEFEEQSMIKEEISLKVSVSSVEIMESKLKRTGAEYSIIESISL